MSCLARFFKRDFFLRLFFESLETFNLLVLRTACSSFKALMESNKLGRLAQLSASAPPVEPPTLGGGPSLPDAVEATPASALEVVGPGPLVPAAAAVSFCRSSSEDMAAEAKVEVETVEWHFSN